MKFRFCRRILDISGQELAVVQVRINIEFKIYSYIIES